MRYPGKVYVYNKDTLRNLEKFTKIVYTGEEHNEYQRFLNGILDKRFIIGYLEDM